VTAVTVLKMEAVCSSEVLVPTHQSVGRYLRKCGNIQGLLNFCSERVWMLLSPEVLRFVQAIKIVRTNRGICTFNTFNNY
jgi:hypothetical protein